MALEQTSDPRIDAILRELDPSLRPIGEGLRKAVKSAAPALRESVKWNVPVWSGQRNVICIMIYPDHLNLGFFQGAKLAAHHPEIEGTGKGLRHLKIKSVVDTGRPIVAKLIREAVELDEHG
jgi:hypothetical protein